MFIHFSSWNAFRTVWPDFHTCFSYDTATSLPSTPLPYEYNFRARGSDSSSSFESQVDDTESPLSGRGSKERFGLKPAFDALVDVRDGAVDVLRTSSRIIARGYSEFDEYAKSRYDSAVSQHFPSAERRLWVSRPQRPGPPKLVVQCVEYAADSLSGRTFVGLQNHKRMFDRDLRRVIMGSLVRIPLHGQPAGHSHATAAAERTSVTVAFHEVIRGAGLTPYVVSAGDRDHRASGGKSDGCRLPYMSKDLLEERLYKDKVSDEHVLVMTDVDYYTDMPGWLRLGRPILLYTMVPSGAAGVHSDGAWELVRGDYVDAAGRASHSGTMMRCLITGGATYEHPLWDYNHDNVSVIDWYGNCITYYVEQRQCPSGRRIVGLFPGSSVAFPYWRDVPRNELGRFEAMVGDIAVVDMGNGKLSISCPGAYEALEVSRIDYVGWQAKSAAVGLKHVVDVEKWMSVSENSKTKAARIRWAPVLFGLLQKGWKPDGAVSMVQATSSVELIPTTPPEHYVCSHSSAPGSTTTGGDVAVAFAPPLVTLPTPVPARCMANAATAHHVRVKLTQKKFQGHAFKHDLGAYAVEFVGLVTEGRKGMVEPLEVSELAERWTRPSQQETVRGLHTLVQPEKEPRTMRGFMKGEVGFKPRQIVNCDGDHNASLALYTLAIMDDLKANHLWVGCGRTPLEVEERVHAVATGLSLPDELRERFVPDGKLTTAHEGDITNCDGSEKRWHRQHITDPIMIGLTVPALRPQLRALLKQEAAGFTVKMAEGYSYEAEWELISGTSATTLKNILKVSFGDYVALRRLGLTPRQAFACLGVYCGDDSVSVALSLPGLAEARVVALADLAMDQKLIERHSPSPVSFLGEYHYGAFFDGGRRLPDFWRQVQKCHLSCSRGIPLDVAAANKACGALSSSTLSDPLLGPWFTKVALLSGDVNKAAMTREERWKLGKESSTHRDRLALRSEVVDEWCDVSGVERSELEDILVKIDAATCLAELPRGVLDNVLITKQLLPGTANASGTIVPVDEPAPVHNDKVEKQRQERREGARNPPTGGKRHPRPQDKEAPRPPRTEDGRITRQLQRGGARAVQSGRGRRPPS